MYKEEKGMLARSKAGHDKNHVYVIIESDGTYVYLADGSSRTLEKPKKKKKKHIQLIHRTYELTGMDDTKIKRILKNYSREA